MAEPIIKPAANTKKLGLKKLLLIRKKDVRANLLDQSGFAQFSKGKPIPVTPKTWNDEQGISHYGYVLEGLMLKDLEALKKWELANNTSTVLSYDKVVEEDRKSREQTLEEVLDSVGLRINELAE